MERRGQCFRNALTNVDQMASSGDLESSLPGHKKACAAKEAFVKAFLGQFDVRLQSPAYYYIRVADSRESKTPIPASSELDKVI